MDRNCLGCGQTDDHPRVLAINTDGSTSYWHHDCHARTTGNPVSTAIAESGFTGDELRQHIQDNDPGGKYLASVADQTAEEN